MERSIVSTKKENSFLGRKTKKMLQTNDSYKSEETDKASFLSETSAEYSGDNIISLEEEKTAVDKEKIPGFDDIQIPSFLNETKKDTSLNKTIEDYNKIKEELGSPELVQLYLVDINRIYKQKKNRGFILLFLFIFFFGY